MHISEEETDRDRERERERDDHWNITQNANKWD